MHVGVSVFLFGLLVLFKLNSAMDVALVGGFQIRFSSTTEKP